MLTVDVLAVTNLLYLRTYWLLSAVSTKAFEITVAVNALIPLVAVNVTVEPSELISAYLAALVHSTISPPAKELFVPLFVTTIVKFSLISSELRGLP